MKEDDVLYGELAEGDRTNLDTRSGWGKVITRVASGPILTGPSKMIVPVNKPEAFTMDVQRNHKAWIRSCLGSATLWQRFHWGFKPVSSPTYIPTFITYGGDNWWPVETEWRNFGDTNEPMRYKFEGYHNEGTWLRDRGCRIYKTTYGNGDRYIIGWEDKEDDSVADYNDKIIEFTLIWL